MLLIPSHATRPKASINTGRPKDCFTGYQICFRTLSPTKSTSSLTLASTIGISAFTSISAVYSATTVILIPGHMPACLNEASYTRHLVSFIYTRRTCFKRVFRLSRLAVRRRVQVEFRSIGRAGLGPAALTCIRRIPSPLGYLPKMPPITDTRRAG